MIWSWGILLTLSILILIWMIISYAEDDDSFGVSVLCAGLLILFGWLMVGCLNDIYDEVVVIDNVEIIETKYYVLVIDGENVFKFNTKKDFEYISDTNTFYYLNGVNMYGGEASTSLKMFYYTYEDTIQKMDTIGVKQNLIKNLGEKL